jgi:hypothetical protein
LLLYKNKIKLKMKNKLILPAVIAAFFFITSCEKEKDKQATVISKVINVDLNENQSYSYNIAPSGDQDDVMEISLQSNHFITSKITTDDLRNTLFEYTPALNYSGTDEIHVTTMEGQHHDVNPGQHGGMCQGHNNGHGDETETNYIFKINIVKTTFP